MPDKFAKLIRIMLCAIILTAILCGTAVFDDAVYAAGDITYHEDGDSAAAELREAMKQRKDSVTIGVTGQADEESLKTAIGNLMELATEHTGVPDEGDYIKFQFAYYKGEARTTHSGLTPAVDITYKMKYYNTAEQEEAVDEKVAEVIKSLDLNNKSDYEKIAAIHDFICESTEYEPAEATGDDIRRTAYGALIDGKAVCQGYCLALYRLLLEAGIDNRIIFGTGIESGGIEGSHTWNIVELYGEYYYIDITWDDSTYSRDYFLIPAGAGFEDEHISSEEYPEDFFTEKYPMAKEEFKGDLQGSVTKLLSLARKFEESVRAAAVAADAAET